MSVVVMNEMDEVVYEGSKFGSINFLNLEKKKGKNVKKWKIEYIS